MSSTAYRALILILFLFGIFGILFTATEDGHAVIYGCITAICFWASGIFFERGFLTNEFVITDLPKCTPAYETQTPDSIMPKSIANTHREGDL